MHCAEEVLTDSKSHTFQDITRVDGFTLGLDDLKDRVPCDQDPLERNPFS